MSRTVAVMIGRNPQGTHYRVHQGYLDALIEVGVQPVIVAAGPGMEGEAILDLIGRCDGVVLTGGGDVDPSIYGQAPGRGERDVDPDRDGIEVAAVHAMLRAGRPVLGICRGVQLLTVALGGTLVPDLPAAGISGHYDEEHQGEPVHAVSAEPGSAALLALAGVGTVNSIHHQAVATTGPSLTATAWSPDGVIEAVEGPFALGVQWHPERLVPTDVRHLAPFRWVVTA